MTQQLQIERRAAAIDVTGSRVTGHAVVFDVRYVDLGGFVEIVRPQAVGRALKAERIVA